MKKLFGLVAILATITSHAALTPVSGSGAVDSVNTQTGVVILNTDNISEGSTNLYFTTARARASVSASSPLTLSSGAFGCQVASGSLAGCLSSADWTTFNAKQSALSFSSPLLNTAGTISLTNVPVSLSGVPASTISYEVDGSRSDSYTADGSISRPYKTVMACINRIIANGDNSQSKVYQCKVHGSQIYAESISLEDTHLTDILLDCDGVAGSCDIRPASGNALQSTANNDLLHLLHLQGFMFDSPVVLSNGGGQHFLEDSGYCSSCTFNSTQSLTNAGDWELRDSYIEDDISLDGSAMFIDNSNGTAGIASINGSTVILDDAVATGTISNDATGTMVVRGGSRLGSDAGTFTNAGTLQLYPSFVRSPITNSGTLQLRGGNIRTKDLTNTGTVTPEVPLANFISFASGITTCTGSSQNVAHGLGYVPQHVLISVQDNNSANFVITEGSHTSTNLVFTCTSGAKVKALAF